MPKPSITTLLKEIKSEEIERAYINTIDKAVEWAVAGFIDEANMLLEKIWSFGTPHSGHLWVQDQGLIVMWHLSGKRPGSVPFEQQDIAAINHANYSGLFLASTLQNHIEHISSTSIESISDYLVAAANNLQVTKSEDEILREIADCETALLSEEGYYFFDPATRGAILCARMGDIEKAEHFIRVWGAGYRKYFVNYTLAYLMREPATAKILLTGILAPVFELTKESIKHDFEAIAAALDERYGKGRGLVYNDMPWKELLTNISRLAIEQQSTNFSNEAISNGWLGYTPAHTEDIARAEARLGITLPEDYKQFLLTSNGFNAISRTGVTLAPVSAIQRYIDVDPDNVELWNEGRDEPGWGEPFKNSIIIGGFEDEQQLLLLPMPDGSWACWFFAFWVPGEHAYPSLRYYMEENLQQLEERFYE